MKYHILRVDGLNYDILNSESYLRCLLLKVAKEINATVLNVYSHKFEPQGASVLVAIAESHINCHTFPCEGVAQFEIATCSEKMNTQKGISFIIQSLNAKKYDYKIITI